MFALSIVRRTFTFWINFQFRALGPNEVAIALPTRLATNDLVPNDHFVCIYYAVNFIPFDDIQSE